MYADTSEQIVPKGLRKTESVQGRMGEAAAANINNKIISALRSVSEQ